jgi:hypothetical protein
MTTEEIKAFVDNQILQSLEGAKGIENNKFDFKREWYSNSMKDSDAQSKFLVDVTAIANSYGWADGFLVIGYDDTNKEFHSSPFIASGLKDSYEVIGMIKKKIDHPFNVQIIDHIYQGPDGTKNNITIVHIPPTLDKPHVIRMHKTATIEYPNEIFIRVGSTNERASKHDLDLMYAEKENVQIDRKAYCSISRQLTSFTIRDQFTFSLATYLTIENGGFRPLAIQEICIYTKNTFSREDPFVFRSERLGNPNFVLNPNEIGNVAKDFFLNILIRGDYLGDVIERTKKELYEGDLVQQVVLILSDGYELRSILHVKD